MSDEPVAEPIETYSLAALGLLMKISEGPVVVERLVMVSIDSRAKILAAANELEAAGAAHVRRQRSEGGWITVVELGQAEETADTIFEQIWAAYPAHRRAAKTACKSKFNIFVRQGHRPDVMLAGLKRQLADWREHPEAIPQVTTWFVHRGWESP